MNALTRLWSPPPSRGRIADRIYERWVLGMSNVGTEAAEAKAYSYEQMLQHLATLRIEAEAITDTDAMVRATQTIWDEVAAVNEKYPGFTAHYIARVWALRSVRP